MGFCLSLGKEGAGDSAGSEGVRDQGWGLLGLGRGGLDGEEPLELESRNSGSGWQGGGRRGNASGKVTFRPQGLVTVKHPRSGSSLAP